MNFRTLTMIALLVAPVPNLLFAGPDEDAAFIVEQTVNKTIFTGAFEALRPTLSSAVQFELEKQGVTASDPEAYLDIYIEEMVAEFVDLMRIETIQYYKSKFSEQELADIAAFYATQSGQAMIKLTPELMQFGAEAGARTGQIAGAQAYKRVELRLQAEGITIHKN